MKLIKLTSTDEKTYFVNPAFIVALHCYYCNFKAYYVVTIANFKDIEISESAYKEVLEQLKSI